MMWYHLIVIRTFWSIPSYFKNLPTIVIYFIGAENNIINNNSKLSNYYTPISILVPLIIIVIGVIMELLLPL